MAQSNSSESDTNKNGLVVKLTQGINEVLALLALYFRTFFRVSTILMRWWRPAPLNELRDHDPMLSANLFFWLTALLVALSTHVVPGSAGVFTSLSLGSVEGLGLDTPIGAVSAFGCAYLISRAAGLVFRKSSVFIPSDVGDAILYVVACIGFVLLGLAFVDSVIPTLQIMLGDALDDESPRQSYSTTSAYIAIFYIASLYVGLALKAITQGSPPKRKWSRLPQAAFILAATTANLIMSDLFTRPEQLAKVLNYPSRNRALKEAEARAIRCDGDDPIECSFFLHSDENGFFASSVRFTAIYNRVSTTAVESTLHFPEVVRGTVLTGSGVFLAGLVPLEDGGLYAMRIPKESLCRALKQSEAIPKKEWIHSTWAGWRVQSIAYSKDVGDVVGSTNAADRETARTQGLSLADALDGGRARHDDFEFVLTGLDFALLDLDKETQVFTKCGVRFESGSNPVKKTTVGKYQLDAISTH